MMQHVELQQQGERQEATRLSCATQPRRVALERKECATQLLVLIANGRFGKSIMRTAGNSPLRLLKFHAYYNIFPRQV